MPRSLVRCLTLLCVFAGTTVARPQPSRILRRGASLTLRDDAPNPQETICGDIIDDVNQGYNVFFASDAYACFLSVPFNPAVAARFVDYYNTTIQLQSTLAYLKNPPQGYQQPAVDVVAELGRIKKNIDAVAYKNQYSFEADLQNVVYRMHDAHVDMYSGILASFVFGSPYNFISASEDGKAPPQVYVKDDLVAVHDGAQFTPSPVVAINGEDTTTFLGRVAALQSVGMLEPHADWNALMSSPAQDIQGTLNILGGGLTFYPGDELNITYGNKTTETTWWTAVYSEPYYTGPLTTGGDYFNYFVLGLLPSSFNESSLPPAFQDNFTTSDTDSDDDSSSSSSSSVWTPHDASTAYPPNPDVLQQNLAFSEGVVTGYFLNDTSTGVLSLPSFQQLSFNLGQFSEAVQEFINRAQDAKLSKVIIDLQGNAGGLVELAFVTFRQFFPGQTPFAGSRRRRTELGNVLGEQFTDYWDKLSDDDEKQDLEASEWVITNRLNANTGKNFSSWNEYYTPTIFNGDTFSLVERYDLANTAFDAANFDGWVPVDYTADGSGEAAEAPWKAENIVVLTDGECSSSCALFVEMLTEMGVRTVVVGGRPTTGPMQAVAGTRGAQPYGADGLDSDIMQASEWIGDNAAAYLPQVRDSGVFVNWASFNLRDQIRKDDKSGTPLQFTYIPADCRLYYTLANAWNMSALWRDVDTAVWKDQSLCVEGSSRLKAGTTISTPPSPTGEAVRPSIVVIDAGDHDGDDPIPLSDGPSGPSKAFQAKICAAGKTATGCGPNYPCKRVEFQCAGKSGLWVNNLCVPRCNNHGAACPNRDYGCGHLVAKDNGQVTFGVTAEKTSQDIEGLFSGFCAPVKGTTDMCNPKKGATLVKTSTTTDQGSSKEATNSASTGSSWSIAGNTASFKSDLLGDIWI